MILSYPQYQNQLKLIIVICDSVNMNLVLYPRMFLGNPSKKKKLWKIPHLGGGVRTRAFSTFKKKEKKSGV